MDNVVTLKGLIKKEGFVARSPSLSEDAATKLREMILLGKLPPGTALPERDLAEALGVSRTPMREAVRLLSNEGLVTYSPTRRPFVADPTLDEINDCLRVQGALEALAGELACQLASDEEVELIERINASIEPVRQSHGSLEAFRADMSFHAAIVEASKNDVLAETHATYNARLWRVRFLSSQREQGREETAREHNEIVKALKKRDASATRKALRAHLRTAEKNIAATVGETATSKSKSNKAKN